MAIITRPSSITRGNKAQFTLSKSELAANSVVSNDGYFSSSSVWSTVSLHYKSNSRDQFEEVLFNAQDANPVGDFFVSSYSAGDFLIEYITITDFDGGSLIVQRANLVTNDFDITF